MRKGHGAEGRLADRAAVHLPSQGTSYRRVVLGGELHEQIVRMLPIVNLLSLHCSPVASRSGYPQPRIVQGSRLNMPRNPTWPVPTFLSAMNINQLMLP